MFGDGHAGTHGQFRGSFGPHPFGDVEKLPRVGEDAARPVDDDGPLRSQSRTRRPSVYEWHPELPLEGFDGAAGIRLCDVSQTACSTEASVIIDADE